MLRSLFADEAQGAVAEATAREVLAGSSSRVEAHACA
jgi:hypothetical protein